MGGGCLRAYVLRTHLGGGFSNPEVARTRTTYFMDGPLARTQKTLISPKIDPLHSADRKLLHALPVMENVVVSHQRL